MNRFPRSFSLPRSVALLAFLVFSMPGLATASGLISGHYVFRSTYAPVCLNGRYPITLAYLTNAGAIRVTTAANGNLSGTIEILDVPGTVTGSLGPDNNNVLLLGQTSGPNPSTQSGDLYAYLHGKQFFGNAENQDGESGDFTMDVSTAGPLVVTFDVNLTVNGQGQVTGSGMATGCGVQIPVTVTGTTGATSALHIVGTSLPQFTWDASGPQASFGFVAAWNGHGYGFNPTGAQLPVFSPNAPALTPYVTSRKNHTVPTPHIPAFLTCDLPLNPGVECRTGGALGIHQLVFSFPKNVTLNPPNGMPAVWVSSGIGSVTQFAVNNNEVVVNLTGVANAQTITVTLAGVSDGMNTAEVIVPASFLLGDINNNGSVNATDISLMKSLVGSAVSPSNCRGDVNLNGAINSSDLALTKSASGTGLPAFTRIAGGGLEPASRSRK